MRNRAGGVSSSSSIRGALIIPEPCSNRNDNKALCLGALSSQNCSFSACSGHRWLRTRLQARFWDWRTVWIHGVKVSGSGFFNVRCPPEKWNVSKVFFSLVRVFSPRIRISELSVVKWIFKQEKETWVFWRFVFWVSLRNQQPVKIKCTNEWCTPWNGCENRRDNSLIWAEEVCSEANNFRKLHFRVSVLHRFRRFGVARSFYASMPLECPLIVDESSENQNAAVQWSCYILA